MIFYKEISEKFPRASVPKRLPLTFTTGMLCIELAVVGDVGWCVCV